MKIGITVSESKTQYYINQAYINYMHEAGMETIPITRNNNIKTIVNMLDGLVLPGGIDLDPIYYGEDNFSSYGSNPEKDEFERSVFHAFREEGKPIFGICRGFQLIIREYLLSDSLLTKFLHFSSEISNHNQVNDQQLERGTYQHYVDFIPSLLYGKSEETVPVIPANSIHSMPVNSMHHQGLIADFGRKNVIGTKGFKMAAWTKRGLKIKNKKGIKESTTSICEAFKIINWIAPILAVQWHPEELMDVELVQRFFHTSLHHNTLEGKA